MVSVQNEFVLQNTETGFPRLFCVDIVFCRRFAVNITRLSRYKDENLERDAQGMYV
jgi:hypothetical protein